MLINVLKGFIIAVSMLVKGVSGATMMMTLRVYNQSLEFLTGLTKGVLLHKKMMLHLTIGALLGLLGFSQVMLWLLSQYDFWLRYFFLGSILVGLILLFKQIPKDKLKIHHLSYLLIGLVIALGLEQLETTALVKSNPDILLVILGGIGIAVALILPGISTSFVLLTLGLYEPVLSALTTFNIQFMAILVLGILIGVLLTAKILVYLLNTHPVGTTILIAGFVIGSLWEVFPGLPESQNNWIVLVMVLAGALLMKLLETLSFHFETKQ